MRHWRVLISDVLHLKRVDGALMERYCMALARAEEAEEQIKEGKLVVLAPESGYPMQNPFISIAKGEADSARKLAAELGITPAERSRLGAHDPVPDDPIAEFLN